MSIFKRIRNKKPKNIDNLFHQAHEEVFEKIDCLECGNCCKTTSPIWNETDIARVSKIFKLKPNEFKNQYLMEDDDKDWVFPSSPCPFLLADNYCQIYELRPKACREYPHTDRKNMMGILKLTEKNQEICPAVDQIIQKIEKLI